MMPSTSPCLNLEAHVLERPEFLDLVALHDLPAADEIDRLARKIARFARDHVAQRRVAARARRTGGRPDSAWRDFRPMMTMSDIGTCVAVRLRSDRQSSFPSFGTGGCRTTGRSR